MHWFELDLGKSKSVKIASNVDDVHVNVDKSSHMVASSTSKYSDELTFVEDTDEKNFVTEPHPARARTRNWMINRVDNWRTTTPTTTQFTLFPTFPTLPTLFPTFQPLFAAFTPFNLFTTTTAQPIQTTTQLPPTTTTIKSEDDLGEWTFYAI